MNNVIAIRPAASNDVDSIYRFVCELENEQFDYDSFTTIYNKNISHPENYYFVAVAIDKVVGFISFHTQNLLHHGGRVGEIQEFFVDKDYRVHGVGQSLMKEIEKVSLRINIKSIEVTSNVERIDNVAVYQRLGFKKTHHKFTK